MRGRIYRYSRLKTKRYLILNEWLQGSAFLFNVYGRNDFKSSGNSQVFAILYKSQQVKNYFISFDIFPVACYFLRRVFMTSFIWSHFSSVSVNIIYIYIRFSISLYNKNEEIKMKIASNTKRNVDIKQVLFAWPRYTANDIINSYDSLKSV